MFETNSIVLSNLSAIRTGFDIPVVFFGGKDYNVRAQGSITVPSYFDKEYPNIKLSKGLDIVTVGTILTLYFDKDTVEYDKAFILEINGEIISDAIEMINDKAIFKGVKPYDVVYIGAYPTEGEVKAEYIVNSDKNTYTFKIPFSFPRDADTLEIHTIL